MKHSIPVVAILALTSLIPLGIAEDKPADEKCKMMQKPVAAAVQNDVAVRRQELEMLVTEMNSNVGPKKIEAMAAILTRLVEQAKIHDGTAGKPATGEGAPKSETPHH